MNEEVKKVDMLLNDLFVGDKTLESFLQIIESWATEDRQSINRVIEICTHNLEITEDPEEQTMLGNTLAALYRVKQANTESVIRVADTLKDLTKFKNQGIQHGNSTFIITDEQRDAILKDQPSANLRLEIKNERIEEPKQQ